MGKPQLAALRVKVKSLAEEQRIIKLEERRAKGRRKCKSGIHPDYKVFLGRDDATRLSLFCHRMGLRDEARATLLAYAFLRGRDYQQVEPKTGRHGHRRGPYNRPNLKRIREIVAKFGVPEKSAVTKGWMDAELQAWVLGVLEKHPFARESKAELVA